MGADISGRTWGRRLTALMLSLLAWQAGAAPDVPLPAAARAYLPRSEAYFRAPTIGQVVLSPSGQDLALTVAGPDGHLRLAVMRVQPLSEPRVLVGFDDADIQSIRWINDARLLFSAADMDVPGWTPRARATYAINADGGEQRQLMVHARYAGERVLTYEWSVHSTARDGSPDIFVTRHHWADTTGEWKHDSIARLNTLTGALHPLVQLVPEGAATWMLDAQGQPRVLMSHVGDKTRVLLRERDELDAPWRQLAEFPRYGTEGYTPWILDGAQHLYVRTALGRDTLALHEYDLTTGRLDPKPLFAIAGFDVAPRAVRGGGDDRILGLRYLAEQSGTWWFDKPMRQLQAGIDAALPGRVNHLQCGRCLPGAPVIVTSESDRQPDEFYLVDRQKGSLARLGAARPWIDAATQGERSFHRVKARDGLSLPVYITRPASAPKDARLPAVVLVHGGPWLRGHHLSWEDEAQFLASLGHEVIEVEFRSSSGYGMTLLESGFKQWGRAMQDDLDDVVQWRVQQARVDADRVCIAGASYGGYAALMGPVRHPGRYRCAISYAGVTDLELMHASQWSDMSDDWKQHGMPERVGDPKTDAQALRDNSPVRRVAQIKVPVLLGYGGRDSRVPPEHALQFATAARQAGVAIEVVEYLDEGHGLRIASNREDWWSRVAEFLARHLGTSAAPSAPSAPSAPQAASR